MPVLPRSKRHPAWVAPPERHLRVLLVAGTNGEGTGTPLSFCSAEYTGPLLLRGAHRRQNAALARAALDLLAPHGLTMPAAAVAAGSAAAELGVLVSAHSTCADALKAAQKAAGARGLVCATGSLSVVAGVRRLLPGDRLLSDGEEPWT